MTGDWQVWSWAWLDFGVTNKEPTRSICLESLFPELNKQ